jgi:hypothetical protein
MRVPHDNVDASAKTMNLDALDTQGYLLLGGAVPPDCLAKLQAAFDDGVIPYDSWPVPRGRDWRHSQLDLDPDVQRICRLPALIDGVRHILKQPFFVAQVEGREPIIGNAPQLMHRDGAGSGGQYMAAMIWLDPFDADNGATQIVPGSHRLPHNEAAEAVIVTGNAGDILLFDPEVLHGATTNCSGARRRSLLISYAAIPLRDQHRQTAALRGVRMDISETFV